MNEELDYVSMKMLIKHSIRIVQLVAYLGGDGDRGGSTRLYFSTFELVHGGYLLGQSAISVLHTSFWHSLQ